MLEKLNSLKKGVITVIGLINQPPGWINFLTSVTGLEFEECYTTKVHIEIQGVDIDFIDLESFKMNKKAVDWYQDLADLENLDP